MLTRRTDPPLDLKIGEDVWSDWTQGRWTKVQVTARREAKGSQTGVQYQVRPALRNCSLDDWLDAAWFYREIPRE